MSSVKVLVAHLGARKHYQEPILFHQWGMLERFYTDFYAGNNIVTKLLIKSKISSYLPKICRQVLDRYDPFLERAKIIHFPKLGYQYTQNLKQVSLQEIANTFIWAGQEFCQQIIDRGIGNANVVYGFNSASLELFEYAKARNIRCVLDQTLAERSLVNQLLLEEEQKWSDWSLSPFNVNSAWLKLAQREQQEQDVADRIICGSDFVKDSLIARGVDKDKISVVSLGRCLEIIQPQFQQDSIRLNNKKDSLKILFAGTVELRKGIPYVLEALRTIKGEIPFTCKVAGSIAIKPERITEYSDVCEFLGRVSRSQMAELYQWADVFVLPSLCEGSAMVIYEALNWGLPVITTYNSGSIVRDGIDGYIVPIRDSEVIASRLLNLFQEQKFLNNHNFQEYMKKVSAQCHQSILQAVTI
jgi:hypothetical protein